MFPPVMRNRMPARPSFRNGSNVISTGTKVEGASERPYISGACRVHNKAFMLSWGRVRRALQPVFLKYWFNQRRDQLVRTRVEGLDLEVFPGVSQFPACFL